LKKTHEINLTQGPMLPKLLQFIIPLTLSSLLQIAFNAADLIVVGRFGRPNALAAVGSNAALVNLVVNTFMGLAIGGGVLCARYFGAQEKESLRRTVSTALVVGGLGGVLVGAAGVLLAQPLLRLIGSPPDVAPLAAVYLKIYFSGLPVIALYNFAAAQLRAMGDTQRPFLFLAIAGVLNVMMNLYFVIVLKIDVAGVALATVLSQCVSCVLTVRCLLREESMRLRDLQVSQKIFRQMLRIGLPAGIQGSLYSVSNFLIQGAVNAYGSAVIAGNTACQSIENFLYCPQDACMQAATTAAGQNMGARDRGRIDRSAWQCVLLVCAVAIVTSGMVMALETPLLHLYTTDPTALAAAHIRLRYMILPLFLNGTMAVIPGTVRGMGHGALPMLVTFFGVCVFRILWLYTIYAAAPSLPMLYLSYPITWILTTIAHAACFFVLRRRDFPPQAKEAAAQ